MTVRSAFAHVGSSDSPRLTSTYQAYWHQACGGGVVGKLHSVRKLHPDQTPGTLLKSEGNGAPYHHDECRAISTAERKRIGSFPDQFGFTDRDAATQRIGNSVPPLFMRAIARHIRSLPPMPLTTGAASYKAALDAAWAEHLAPRAADAPTVISTFAGCGGSSLGYSMAGFRELLAVEWEQNAADTFRLNFPEVPLYHGDIAKLSVDEALRRTGLAPGELDVFDGSPPCQGFSTAGKRDFGDGRNQLFREYVRLLRGLRPKVFVMENVSGMVKGKMKVIFAEILRELKASGYAVKARLLNAMFFGVPQSRERMIFIGVRNDLAIEPSHPQGSAKVVSVREALKALPSLDGHRHVSSRVAAACKVAHPGFHTGLGSRGMGTALLETSGKSSSGMSLAWPSWDRPCFTICKQEIADSGTLHPSGERYLHPEEIARVGSFPDAFTFIGNRKMVIERVGNSVPPLLMRAVSRHIATSILAS